VRPNRQAQQGPSCIRKSILGENAKAVRFTIHHSPFTIYHSLFTVHNSIVTGPDYISFSDWHAKRNSRAGKTRRFATWALTALALVVAGFIFIPPTVAAARARSIARSLDAMGSYGAKIYTYGAGSGGAGERKLFRQESVAPRSMHVQLWDGAVRILRNQRVQVEEPNAHILRLHSGWVGPAPIAHMLSQTFEMASRWSVLHPSFEQLGRDRLGRLVVRAKEPLTRTTLWMDKDMSTPIECLIETSSYQGWEPIEDIEFGPNPWASIELPEHLRMGLDGSSSPSVSQGDQLSPDDHVFDMSSPKTWAQIATSRYAAFTLGEQDRIVRRADANVEGSIFLMMDSLRPGIRVEVTRDGKREPYTTALEQWAPPKTQAVRQDHALILTVARVDSSAAIFPLKLHFKFEEPSADSVGIGDLDVTIPAPTCQVVPFYEFQPLGNEFLYYSAMAHAAELRAAYYSNPRSSSLYQGAGNLGLVAVQDRAKAITNLDTKIFYTRLRIGYTPSDSMASDWLTLYDLLRSLGRDDEARRALELAASTLPTDSRRGEIGLRIRRAQSEIQAVQ